MNVKDISYGVKGHGAVRCDAWWVVETLSNLDKKRLHHLATTHTNVGRIGYHALLILQCTNKYALYV